LKHKDYNLYSKLLHRFALGSSFIKKVAFELDCMVAKTGSKSFDSKQFQPVLISGLARAGTTILLEAIYGTGDFVSLTYRNMPFITAPYLWQKIAKLSSLQAKRQERAHGDRLAINYDSPEAFEEVFWKTFLNDDFIKEDCLEMKEINDDFFVNYKKFIRNVLSSEKSSIKRRYLAKNNNNILRIEEIRKEFNSACIIIPFRYPLDHAKSLLAQHRRFRKIHTEDHFALEYMNWLGHHEFGGNFKPFKFDQDAIPKNSSETGELNYWLRYWISVYKKISEYRDLGIIFLDYNKLCAKPKEVLGELAGKLEIEPDHLTRFASKIKGPKVYEGLEPDKKLLISAESIYKELQNQGL